MKQGGTLAVRLKQYRVAAGLTQERLAECANLSVRGLSNLERGRNTAPRAETLERLMEAFGLSYEERVLLRAFPRSAAVDGRTVESGRDQAPLNGRRDPSLLSAERLAPAVSAAEGSTGASRGLVLLREGRVVEGAVEIELACRLALPAGQIRVQAEILARAAAACLRTAEWELSLDYSERGLGSAERSGDAARVVFLHFLRGCVLLHKGEWADAQATLERGADLAEMPEAGPAAHCLWLGLGHLALARGELDRAARCLERGARQAISHDDARFLPYLQAGMAELDLLAARPRAAQTRLRRLLDLPEQQEATAYVQVRLAWAHFDLGELDAAARVAADAVSRARAEHLPISVVDGLWVQARALLGRGDRLEAASVLDEALAAARRLPYAGGTIRIMETAADLYTSLGYPVPARIYQDEARSWRDRLDDPVADTGCRTYAAEPPGNPPALLQNLANPLQKPAASLQNQAALLQNDPSPDVPRLTDAQWARISALLPPRAGTGRPRADDRRTLEAILYVRRTGCAWSALPPTLGDGTTAYRRLRAWQAAGLWEAILALLDEADEPAPRAR